MVFNPTPLQRIAEDAVGKKMTKSLGMIMGKNRQTGDTQPPRMDSLEYRTSFGTPGWLSQLRVCLQFGS